MSECVVRMEMPKNCWGCPCGQNSWIWGDDGKEKMACFCGVDANSEADGHYILETYIEPKRLSWCPIICQLPEGHGRLVDADEILKKSKGKYGDFEITAVAMEFYGSHIIVPAEAERSET